MERRTAQHRATPEVSAACNKMDKQPLPTTAMDESPEEFETLYRSHAPLIYRFMFWRTRNEMLAEDLTSNVFEKAWRTRHNFSGGSAKAWLYRIARTTLIDYWRKQKDLAADETAVQQLVSDQPPLDEALDRATELAELQQALQRLPTDMRAIVQARFIAGKSARETGASLGLSEANVRVIQYRALKKLRSYLS